MDTPPNGGLIRWFDVRGERVRIVPDPTLLDPQHLRLGDDPLAHVLVQQASYYCAPRGEREFRVPKQLWNLLETGLGFAPNAYVCSKCGWAFLKPPFEPWEHRTADANERYRREHEDQLARRHCDTCDHWHGLYLRRDEPTSVVVDGLHYIIHREPTEQARRENNRNGWGCYGFGGSRFDIRFHDGRHIVSHNLYTQGEIPDCWRADLPDNAVFVKEPRPGETAFKADPRDEQQAQNQPAVFTGDDAIRALQLLQRGEKPS
jgi:hypothetical protein